ncbi:MULTISPECIES: flagellar brake protein [Paenibacillus]|uniref:C-di-GMP-binding flagellar brake protein YcgR n=1 Tax=Paenibacillus lactis TaxID=228574 RepID=A0ABS4F9J2_9BACL|nr:flagellar brake domain-containing protein [Paenibacillus lactis]MBP1892917.1 c-di-GMP-binding flagellar brake protein YcgR [Paenibacillus lactis]HAF97608.1 glycosyl transferase [Paenibacillus lactis]
MSALYPKINEVLYIQLDTGDQKEAEVLYKSRISDMDGESIYMEVPLQEGTGRLKKLYIGDEISAYFLTEGGVKNYFNSYVLSHHEDVIKLVRIKKPESDQITKVQRRGFLRVQSELEVAVTAKDGARFLTKTEDVGGGGISLYLEPGQSLKEGDLLDCWILVPYKNGSVEHIPFEGEVVRLKELPVGRSIVMMKFTQILDMERQKLIRYCFERQFDLRNR